MNIISANESIMVPEHYTGIVKFVVGTTTWFKDGKRHREDGPASIWATGRKIWYLEDKLIWSSGWKPINLKDKIIFSKEIHPEYPTVQIWKYLDKNGIREQVIISGMEEYVVE